MLKSHDFVKYNMLGSSVKVTEFIAVILVPFISLTIVLMDFVYKFRILNPML